MANSNYYYLNSQYGSLLSLEPTIIPSIGGNLTGTHLDRLSPESRTAFEKSIEKEPEELKVCILKYYDCEEKARAARAAGQVIVAEHFFQQCVAAMKEAGADQAPFKMSHLLAWAYYSLGEIYRFDLHDHQKAIDYYRACVLATEVTATSTITHCISETMYERAHDATLDLQGDREQLLAEAVVQARKDLPKEFDESASDPDVKKFLCNRLSRRYEELGRHGGALFWNEERLKLMQLDEPKLIDDVRLRSAYLRSIPRLEQPTNVLSELKRKWKGEVLQDPKSERLWSLSYVSDLARRTNPVGVASMSKAAIDSERKEEELWAQKFRETEPDPARIAQDTKAKEILERNALLSEGAKFRNEKKLLDAIGKFEECLDLISKGHPDKEYVMMCHMNIGEGYFSLFSQAKAFEANVGEDHGSTTHFHKAKENYEKGLSIGEQKNDIFALALFNKLLGLLFYRKCQFSSHDLSKDVIDWYMALNFLTAAGRNVDRILYDVNDPDHRGVSDLESCGDETLYCLIQRVIFTIVTHVAKYSVANPKELGAQLVLENRAQSWHKKALLWAERGHSRTLAFKLVERNFGNKLSTRMELQKLDLSDWENGWAEIRESQGVCGPNTVMVEYVELKSSARCGSFCIYVVTQEGIVDMCIRERRRDVQLYDKQGKPLEDLPSLITKLNCHMSQDMNSKLESEELMEILEFLYDGFISPLQRILDTMESHHKLIICANGILAGVPFAALRNPGSKEYLIQRHTMAFTPSLRTLKHYNARLQFLQGHPLMEGTGAALVLGDPALNQKSARLEGTGMEVDIITKLLGLGNVVTLKGTTALKKEVLVWAKQTTTSCRSYQAMMHLATHGKATKDRFREGALEFADPNVKTWPPTQSKELQQLGDSISKLRLLSEQEMESLPVDDEAASKSILSPQPSKPTSDMDCFQGRGQAAGALIRRPAPARMDDPRHLTSEEIVQLDLEWRALLVVLSACDTAKGEVMREGILNLARAFLLGGVPSTIVSQWKVDDASAPVFMATLYTSMIVGMDVACALRSSMVRMIESGRFQVHQWAPFMVMGLGTVSFPDRFLDRGIRESERSKEVWKTLEGAFAGNRPSSQSSSSDLTVSSLFDSWFTRQAREEE